MRNSFVALLLCTALFSCRNSNPVESSASTQDDFSSVPFEQKESGTAVEKSSGDTVVLRPEEDASGFVLLTDIIPDAILEIRYYSTYNFIGDRIPGYEQPIAILTRQAADSLKAVSDELLAKGYRLKIFDAYRPQCAVDYFVKWAKDLDDTKMKEYFYPELDKTVLFPRGFIASRSGHTRGSTVDLTLFDMKSEKEVDMGCTYDYFGVASHADVLPGQPIGTYRPINDAQYRNRMILRTAMSKHGFKPYSGEWWHFTLRNEPYPDTYFTFPLSVSSLQ